MGACQSCFGKREKQAYDESEENRLIDDDASALHYGSFGDGALHGDDTAEAQRENDALQRVVAKTSSNMVDVFDIAPQEPAIKASSASFAYSNQGGRIARYQHLVSKLSTEEDEQPAGVKIDWLAENDIPTNDNERPLSLKTLDGDDDALVGTFADAAAAMK